VLEQFASWVTGIVRDMGYPGVFILIMLESTLVPIPSELVMPAAGFMASQGAFSLPVLLLVNSVAALVGSSIGYWVGAVGGKPLLLKYGKFVLVRKHDIEKTETYFARHGKATIFVGRLLPVVRHFISIPAGIARMPLRSFLLQTFLGSTLWGGFLIVLGYELGDHWETVAKQIKHVDLLVGGIIILGLLALAIRFVVRRRRAEAAGQNNPE
jgi:membrane protein DedA with SNARE-associated domain